MNWPSGAAQAIVQRSDQASQDLDAGVVFVVRADQDPGRRCSAGAFDHLAGGGLVGLPFLAVAPILRGNLELLEAGFLAQGETPELLLL